MKLSEIREQLTDLNKQVAAKLGWFNLEEMVFENEYGTLLEPVLYGVPPLYRRGSPWEQKIILEKSEEVFEAERDELMGEYSTPVPKFSTETKEIINVFRYKNLTFNLVVRLASGNLESIAKSGTLVVTGETLENTLCRLFLEL
jgi:hypothetical protein